MAMTKMVRRAAAAGLVAALAVAGCSSKTSTGGSSTAKGGKTSLTWFMWAGSAAEVKAWTTVAAMVTKKYPNITVRFQSTGYPDYWTKVAAEASGGQLPCLVGMQSLRVPGLGKLMHPISDSDLSKNSVNVSDFDPTIISALKFNGQLVALPYDLGPYMIFYNRDMFKAAGVAEPQRTWTADQFLTAAKKLTTGGKYGFAAFPFIDAALPFATSIFGAEAVTKDGKLQLTDKQFESAMQWYANLVSKEKVAPPVPATSDVGWPVNQFLAGSAAMIVDGPWDVLNIKSQAKFRLGVAPMPSGPGGAGTVIAGSGFAVSASCKSPDQAMQALSVITGPEALAYLGAAGRALPARTAQQAPWFKNAVPGAAEAIRSAASTAQPYRSTTQWNQVSQLFTQYGTQPMNGSQSVSTWLQNVQTQAG